MFKISMITKDGIRFDKVIEETFAPPTMDRKVKDRKRIDEEVFDLHDSIADTTKWLSLLTTLCSRLYAIMPEEQKSTLTQGDRYLIEYVFTKFASTDTIADVKLQQEGITMIDRILDRQKTLGEIVS